MTGEGLEGLLEKLENSEKVLVGIGEEFQYDWERLISDRRYQEIVCLDHTFFTEDDPTAAGR